MDISTDVAVYGEPAGPGGTEWTGAAQDLRGEDYPGAVRKGEGLLMKPEKQSPGKKICLIVALIWTVGAVLWGAQIWSALETDASSWGHYILLLLLFAACALRWFWKWLHTET